MNASASPATPGAALDPDIRRFIAITGAAYREHPPLATLSAEAARAVAEKVREPWRQGGPAMVEQRELQIPVPGGGHIRARLLRPVGGEQALPALIYVHGGGWMLFSIDTHDRIMREYAARTGIAVLGIDYSYAPAARFPVALGEVIAAIAFVRAHALELGIDAGRVALGGDSAGANMTLAACMALRDSGQPRTVSAMLLNYGAFDDTIAAADARRYGGPEFMLAADEMDVFWNNYLRDAADRRNPLAIPMRGECAGLPPAFMAIAECDVLCAQNEAMRERLRAAAVPTQAVVYRGASHSFLEAVSIAPLAARALQDGANWLRQRLTAPPEPGAAGRS